MRFILFTLSLVLLTACGDQARTQAIESKLAKLRAKPQGKIEALPNYPDTVKANYQQQARDPFAPTKNATQNIELTAPDPNRPLDTLEKWNLSQLSFRGSMQKGKDKRALTKTPENQLVSVARGDRIGKDHGIIIHLDQNSLTLSELISSGSEWHQREKIIYISK